MHAPVAAPQSIESTEPITASARIVALYIFLLFCRILEMLPLFGLGQLRLMLLVTVVALVLVFLTGNLLKAVKTSLGVLLIAWTAWMIICMPFSTWRSETLNQFLNNWLKSLMVFFIVAGLASTKQALHKAMSAMGWAAAAACLLVLPGLAAAGTGNGVSDRLFGVGTLSNPNEIAFHLWLGMSFLVLLAVHSRPARKFLLLAICCLELALILKTVSREGLLLALVILVFTLLRVSLLNKTKLIAGVFALCLFGVLSLSRQSLDRYLTLFTSRVSSEAASSATASSRMRHQKLMESIELTMRHPIFGVGMGVFMPASVEIAKEKGVHGDWEVSHNSFTQVSSELGFPGILLLLLIYSIAFRQLWQIDRLAKRRRRENVRQQAFVLMLALAVLCIHFCFDSMAYVFYMPLITGLIAAFAGVYRPLLLEPHLDHGLELDTVQTTATNAPIAPRRNVAGSDTIPSSQRNPYRFGRKR